jgi:hypothetical protein
MLSGPAHTRPDLDTMLEFVRDAAPANMNFDFFLSAHAPYPFQIKAAISNSHWAAVLHITTSIFDSGLFLPCSDPASCDKLSLLLLSAVKFILKCKQPQRACEVVELAHARAPYLLSTELVSVFAMGMRKYTHSSSPYTHPPPCHARQQSRSQMCRSLNYDSCRFCSSLLAFHSPSHDPETVQECAR